MTPASVQVKTRRGKHLSIHQIIIILKLGSIKARPLPNFILKHAFYHTTKTTGRQIV